MPHVEQTRRLAHRNRRQSRGLSGRDQQPLFRNRQRRRPALYPASRRPERFCQDAGQDHAGLRRLQRQPAIHHPGQSLGKSEGAYLRDGLRPSPPGEDLGRGARGRRRSGAAEIADAAGLQGAARTGDPVQDFGVGHQLPAAHPAEIRRRRRGGGAGRARRADRRTGSGTRRIEGRARRRRIEGIQAACRSGVQAKSG